MTDRIGSLEGIGSCGSFFYSGDKGMGALPLPIWTGRINKGRYEKDIFKGRIGQCT